MVQLEDVFSAAPRARGLTLPVQCRLSLRLFCAVSGREAVLSAGHTTADSSVNEYKTAFPSTCHLLTVWNYKYEYYKYAFLFVVFLVCYSDAGSALIMTVK